MLNGVSVARRKRLNPADVTTSRMRASPAWAPRHSPTSCDREQGVHNSVEKRIVDSPYRIQIVLQLVVGKGLDDHPRAVLGQRLPDVRSRPDRVAHVVQAIEDGDEVVVFAGKILCLCHLEGDAVGDTVTLWPTRAPPQSTCRGNRIRRIATSGMPSPSESWKPLSRSRRRPPARPPRVSL